MNNNKYKILLVEDESHIREFVSAILEVEGYQVIMAKNCKEGKMMYNSYMPDLIVLDLGLPDADGMEILDEIRKNSITPVIVLSARTDERDKVAALDKGANDYVTKPFGSAELCARIRSALRSSRHSSEEGHLPGKKFVLKDLVIDYDSRRVFIKGGEIKLTKTEYDIVAFLSERCGKVLTYSAIIKAVWGYPDEGSIKKLQVNMANIRKKFGAKPGENNYIINELGVGYRMNGDNE